MTLAKPLLATTALFVLAAGTPSERVVDPTGTATVTVAGVPATVRVDPAANGVLILTDNLADRAKLRAGPIGFYFGVGPENVAGHSAVRPVSFGGKTAKQRISWTARPYAPGFDGAIGPAGVPEEVVTFVLRAPQPGERTVTLAMVGGGGLFGRYDALKVAVPLDEDTLSVRFDPHNPRTLATAGAGLRLAAALGGERTGTATLAPITFGIERPVQPLRLARPLAVGPLAVTDLAVRTRDYGNAERVGEDERTDPDEVVITAKGKRDRHRDELWLGADALARCSTIVFDKARKQVRLTCG